MASAILKSQTACSRVHESARTGRAKNLVVLANRQVWDHLVLPPVHTLPSQLHMPTNQARRPALNLSTCINHTQIPTTRQAIIPPSIPPRRLTEQRCLPSVGTIHLPTLPHDFLPLPDLNTVNTTSLPLCRSEAGHLRALRIATRMRTTLMIPILQQDHIVRSPHLIPTHPSLRPSHSLCIRLTPLERQ